jgi:hypothetical protein
MARDGLHKYGTAKKENEPHMRTLMRVIAAASLPVALFGTSLIACAQMPSSPAALTREESGMSTEEREEVLPQSKFGAEAALLKLLELIRGSKSIEDFTPERVSKVMGLQMHFDGDRFGAAEGLTPDWSYGFYVNRAGLDGPLFLFSFDPRGSNKNPPANAICQFDFDSFAREMQGIGFSHETIYGEHGRLISHRFDRVGFYIQVATEGEAGDPVEKITHECVRTIVIR